MQLILVDLLVPVRRPGKPRGLLQMFQGKLSCQGCIWYTDLTSLDTEYYI
jgi:hypothetical protein